MDGSGFSASIGRWGWAILFFCFCVDTCWELFFLVLGVMRLINRRKPSSHNCSTPSPAKRNCPFDTAVATSLPRRGSRCIRYLFPLSPNPNHAHIPPFSPQPHPIPSSPPLTTPQDNPQQSKSSRAEICTLVPRI